MSIATETFTTMVEPRCSGQDNDNGIAVVGAIVRNERRVSDVEIENLPDRWRIMAAQLRPAHATDRPHIFIRETSSWPDQSEMLLAILGDDDRDKNNRVVADASPSDRSHLTVAPPSMPALPVDARPDSELAALGGRWLDSYMAYAVAVSPMTPGSFHESGGLFLVSQVIARRLRVRLSIGDIFPNLYILWIALSTIYSKTTALNVVRRIASHHFPHLLASQEFTPEALLTDMAGVEPLNLSRLPESEQAAWRKARSFCAQQSLLNDEISGLFARSRRDYNAGLTELLLHFYDCPNQYRKSTRGNGLLTIQNVYLSLIGASTPAAMAPYMRSEENWDNGLLSRCAILVPDDARPAFVSPSDHEVPPPDAVVESLLRLSSRLPDPAFPEAPEALVVMFGDGAFDKWQAYIRAVRHDMLIDGGVDHRLHATYGRLTTQVLKIATILAAMDWPGDRRSPVIELRHLHRALTIGETWRQSAHRALASVSMSKQNEQCERILKSIAKGGAEGVTINQIRQNNRDIDQRDIVQMVQSLLVSGEIEQVPDPEKRGRGRPTNRYRIVRD